jgi:thiamine-monophosphate kinase
VNEFELIDRIVARLGDAVRAPWLTLGPGDDAAIVAVPEGVEVVSSIDSLLEGVHFPAGAPGELVGYRAMIVSLSDLVAMAARPGWVLIAASLPGDAGVAWVESFADGVRAAAERHGIPVAGGNLARGPLTITVSAHGFVERGRALTRSGARPGDRICLTGAVGGAAYALASGAVAHAGSLDALGDAARAYWAPELRFDAVEALAAGASAGIDVSDGLLQDLGHLCSASRVGAALATSAIPVASGASLDQAFVGGDDYVVCFTTASSALASRFVEIGTVTEGDGIVVDGAPVAEAGYRHFT